MPMISLPWAFMLAILSQISALIAGVGIVLFPGLPLSALIPQTDKNVGVRILPVIALSLSTWIAVFTLLKFIALPLDVCIFSILLISMAVWIIRLSVRKTRIRVIRPDIWMCGVGLILSLLFGQLAVSLIAPSGGDMATHSYIARLILEKNTYPDSYEPLIPIRHFGSYSSGMPLVIAVVSRTLNIPIYTGALLVTIATYVWFGLSLYYFLQHFFPRPISAGTALFATLCSPAVLYYLPWGGNPTVLSLGFLVQAITLSLELLSAHKTSLSVRAAILPGLVFFASFATHHIPFIASLYALIPILIGYALQSTGKRFFFRFTLTLAGTLALLSIPFFLDVKYPSPATLELIRDWQRGDHGHVWRGTLSTIIPTLPLYLMDRLGSLTMAAATGALLVTLFIRRKIPTWFVWTLGMGIFGIINSRYWLLPLSPLLYPERISTILIIPFSWSIALGITESIQVLKRLKPNGIGIVLGSIGISVIIWGSIPAFRHNFSETIARSQAETSVTGDDLRAILWIAANTPAHAIIANNYGDAGIWIPAIAYRKVTYNDANPYDFDELFAAQRLLTPTYMYIGAKIVYSQGDHLRFTISSPEIRNASPVFRSGNARVFPLFSP